MSRPSPSLGVIESAMPTRGGDQLVLVNLGKRQASAVVPAAYEAREGRQVRVRPLDNGKVEIIE